MPSDEQKRHWAKEYGLLVSILTVLLGYGVGGLWWAGNLNSHVKSLATVQDAHAERITAIESGRILDNQAITRLEERIAAQQASIERVETTVNEIMRFLRETR
jgi:uncharacterized small protein (DUF1192 family)